jgi:hypothetical protein
MYIEFLRQDARIIREKYLKKPIPKGNVAIVELYLDHGVIFGIGATSRAKSPIAILPLPKSKGGQFEPSIDSYSQRIMDTDAEYKALSAIAETLEYFNNSLRQGKLYLYTERKPCESCQNIVEQFKAKFPQIHITIFWDYPYP